MDYVAEMKSLPKNHDFFIGYDSDGCVFDTMEIKQKECFCPNFIKYYGLQAASKYAREVWQFVNLYSKTRGCNRFLAVQRALELINDHEEFAKRGVNLKSYPALDAWIEEETKLGNPALESKVAATSDEELTHILKWSVAVNDCIAAMVFGIPPFPGVKEVLAKSADKADQIVVSQTPLEALTREWKENKIDHYLGMICGQEHGTKTEHLKYTAAGKYDSDKVLMIGDAPGDLKAAKANNVLFYPIIPGREEESWAKLNEEGIERFFNGTYAGAFQESLLDDFDKALPALPPWK
ncbi:HAD hydrolase-like protein [Lentisphaerota bacterium ZTH]|nr:HAD family hydrolase [Lentisphaerota bacterium]WET07513.1 HAD hydrolase-like protein [Lentisphaerota bacterium ZTH]